MAVTKDVAPQLTITVLNNILAKTVANATPAELKIIQDALARLSEIDQDAAIGTQIP